MKKSDGHDIDNWKMFDSTRIDDINQIIAHIGKIVQDQRKSLRTESAPLHKTRLFGWKFHRQLSDEISFADERDLIPHR